MTFKATYLGSNGWIIEFSDTKIVIDPWISGDLIFPPGEWFFKGNLKDEIPTPQNVSIILITQGLPDHCHLPSLKQFNRQTPIICPNSAYESLRKLGFISIKIMNPSDQFKFENINLRATAGAPVPQIENGYILQHEEGSFYIEPHGFLDKKIKPIQLDAVITPTKNIRLPLVGSFVKGADVIQELIRVFEPRFILSSTIGGDAEYSGILNKFISVESFQNKVNCKLFDLEAMETATVE